MKKFFSLFVTAAVALFGLTCCGGGSDGELDYMSIKDFAGGAKKFRVGYPLVLDICPEGVTSPNQLSELSVTMIPGMLNAGSSSISVLLTYWMEEADATTAYLKFSMTDGHEDLADPNLLTALGFAVNVDDEALGGASSITSAWSSISGLDCKLEFDFATKSARCDGTYNAQGKDEDGNAVGPMQAHHVYNGVVPFMVMPK